MNKLILFFTLLTFSIKIFAEEGMLIPSLLAAFESDMKAKGMKMSVDDIYNVNHSSLKDAVFQFGGGCTAELVSDKGLLLTNHHCGYYYIQSHSSIEKDYLKNGYWAKNASEELKNPGLTAMRIVRIEDVTKGVFFGTEGMADGIEKFKKIKANIAILVLDATMNNGYTAEIKEFNYGNDYYLMVQETFNDIRFVGTPPNSVGKFGGDTDNWVWPRHTGDFSVFRIYTGTDNKPADFSSSNIPYKPLHYLPISFKDRKVGDFTLVYGFPGTTEQHVVSDYLKYIIETERPARIKMRDLSLSVIDAGMKSSDEIRIKYSSKQAGIANGWKKWIGQIDGLRRLDAVQKKTDYEKKYTEKAFTKPEWQKYQNVVSEMNVLTKTFISYDLDYAMGVEYFYVGPEMFKIMRNLEKEMGDYDSLSKTTEIEKIKTKWTLNNTGFFKNFDAGIDKEIFRLQTKEYLTYLQKTKNIDLINFDADKIYDESIFTNEKRFNDFINANYGKKKFKKRVTNDPLYKFYLAVSSYFDRGIILQRNREQARMESLLKTYVEGKYVMFPNDKHWPDANSTLRVTYGQLEGSIPADGVEYTEHTTTDGIIAKYNSGNPDFELLPGLLEKYKEKDFGQYAQNGELWVCFTGSNHTTGGNSGSPVIDGNGNLMGLNFDRSWESTMSDFNFDPDRCRNITVDIRYVLWVIDKYSGAGYLIDEMKIVR